MWIGDIVLERFVVERPAGSGGMGMVFRALDRATGGPVAIKVLDGTADANRFVREARVLAELRHPAIVRYIADGVSTAGEPFLVMEWLQGETLTERLARKALSVTESIVVAQRVANALAAAHARGIVHRDVKPDNLFLVGDQPDRIKLLDFGIARLDSASRVLTGTGTLIGTIGYMAPEQARGVPAIDARADVFSLGCVLYECLLGEPAFGGSHAMAVMAKLLLENPLRPSERIPGLPDTLDGLVTRMLSKDPSARPADAVAVASELETIAVSTSTLPPLAAPRSMTDAEQRLVSVIVVDARRRDAGKRVTLTPDEALAGLDAVEAVARRFGAEVTAMAAGAVLVTLRRQAGRLEDTARVAACALSLHRALPASVIALATGRAQTTGRLPLGIAIDRAVDLASGVEDEAPMGVLVDGLTRSLVMARFEIHGNDPRWLLTAEKSEEDEPPAVLGKILPCVGRDIELATLRATLRDCVEGPTARAVLVTAAAGTGKTRLWRELVRDAREDPGLRILVARASPIGVGSSFSLMRELVRTALGVHRADPPATQRSTLEVMVAELFPEADRARASDFLGELIGLPPREARTPAMIAARNDPQLMGEWTRRTLDDWLGAFVERHPTLVILEDLHWGDAATVSQLATLLKHHAESPLMVLALARPEVRDAFPGLWPGHHEIRLGGLTRRAAASLVRSALGDQLDPAVVDALVTRADGNAFFLEEVIRAAAAGSLDGIPETVLALVESRLAEIEPDARRVLRAASVFGETAWVGGVTALLGERHDASDTAFWLDALVDREVLVHRSGGRFAGETEHAFRHALWREAAYATLTVEDRRAGHVLAGAWLEQVGEKDPIAIAEHFERGGAGARAAEWFAVAAEHARAAMTTDEAIQIANRGLACGAEGQTLGRLLLARGHAFNWSGAAAAGAADLRSALELLPDGSEDQLVAISGLFGCATTSGNLAFAMEGFIAAQTKSASSRRARSGSPAPSSISRAPSPCTPWGVSTKPARR